MLVQGDMLVDLAARVEPESVDLVIIDPPYGIGSKKLAHKEKNWKKSDEDWDQFESVQAQRGFYQRMLGVVWPLLKPTGSLFCFGSYHNIFQCGDILQTEIGGKLVNSITWYKCNAMFSVTRSSLIESNETAIWCAKSKGFFFNYEASKSFNHGQQLRNVWTSPITENSERVGHPHQKPTWLYHRLVKIACPPEGFVVDPMCGSGTTAVVCEAEKLRYLCMEKNPKFYAMAQERIKNIPQGVDFT
jgi:DNA modification methylase